MVLECAGMFGRHVGATRLAGALACTAHHLLLHLDTLHDGLRLCSAVRHKLHVVSKVLRMQTKNTFEVKADLPGVEKKDIKVNVDGDVLTISHEHTGKKEDKKEENGVKYHVSLIFTSLETLLSS